MIVGPLLVLCVAYYARGALAARSQTPVLDARDAETLKSVFFSGEPWLVECTSAKRPSAAFFDVEKLMAAQPVASEVQPHPHPHPSLHPHPHPHAHPHAHPTPHPNPNPNQAVEAVEAQQIQQMQVQP